MPELLDLGWECTQNPLRLDDKPEVSGRIEDPNMSRSRFAKCSNIRNRHKKHLLAAQKAQIWPL